jgi:catechol 2,3-dioxygenase-like lactoylglutathione lyase family enzyme
MLAPRSTSSREPKEKVMLKTSPFYAGFAVDDLTEAKRFYADTLGVFRVVDVGGGLLSLHAGNGYAVLIYEKDSHEPAQHTILTFPVDDIEATVHPTPQGRHPVRAVRRRPAQDEREGHRHPGAQTGLVQRSGRKHSLRD